jgi:hypothetical protein
MPGASLADRRINTTIATGSGMFVLALAISAAFVPELRVLHFFQALIYVAVVAMTRRKSAMGFGAGLAVPVFWNALSVFVTGDARDGIRELGTLVRKGQTQHPDVLVSLFAFCGHLLIIIGGTVGFIRIRPSARQWAQLLVGGVIALSYLITIVFVFGTPQAVDLMKHVFGR